MSTVSERASRRRRAAPRVGLSCRSPTTACSPTATRPRSSSRDGSIDWLCLPRYDSPAVFARMLDPDAGHWSIPPAGVTSERRYLPGTLVIETTFTTTTGTVRLRDALAFARASAATTSGRDAPHELLRLRRGRRGRGRARDGARAAARVRPGHAAVPGRGRRRAHVRRPEPDRRSRAGVPVEVEDATMHGVASRSAPGEPVGFALRWAAGPRDARRRAARAGRGTDRRTPSRRGAPGRPSTTSTRASTATSSSSHARAEGPDLSGRPARSSRRRRRRCPRRRRRAQLGLPLRVDPRREPDAARRSTSARARTRPRSSSRS